MDRLADGLVYLCRASGEGSHDFRVCPDEASVGAFYQEMTGEDEGGGIDSLWRDFRDPDCWGDDGTSLELELYCAKFEVWKVDARQLTVAQAAGVSITKPAQIGGTIFHPGIAVQTVIDRAYREHNYQQTPEREAERLAKAERFRQAVSTPRSAELSNGDAVLLENIANHADHDDGLPSSYCDALKRIGAAIRAGARDAARLLWLETLLKHCPHAELTWCDDKDEGPLGWRLLVESCSTLDLRAPTLEALIDLGMTAEADEDGNVTASADTASAPRRCREGADRDCSPACDEKSRTYCSWKGF